MPCPPGLVVTDSQWVCQGWGADPRGQLSSGPWPLQGNHHPTPSKPRGLGRCRALSCASRSQGPRVIGAEPRAWLLELAKEGEESPVQLVQKPWPGWESQLRGEGAKPSIPSSGGHCPWRTGAGIGQGQGRNAGPGAGQRLHQAQCTPGGHTREGRVFWSLGENPGGSAPGARFMVGPPGFQDSASSLP